MTLLDLPDWLGKPLAVFLIDLLLAGDNALVIALVCLSLPPRSRRVVLLIGTVGAIVLRVALTSLAGTILGVPGLKLVGALLLALLALNLARPDPREARGAPAIEARSDVVAAAFLVILIDLLMSLDNVLALAAVAGDSVLYLVVGLLLSVSILMFGSALVAELLGRFPALARLGAVLLGWVAGHMAVSDTLLQGWIAVQAPVLPSLVPALVAAYVYLLARNAPTPAPAINVTTARPPPPRTPRPRPAAAVPISAPPISAPPVFMPAPARVALPATEAGPPERLPLILLLTLFVVAGLLLTGLAIIGGGTNR